MFLIVRMSCDASPGWMLAMWRLKWTAWHGTSPGTGIQAREMEKARCRWFAKRSHFSFPICVCSCVQHAHHEQEKQTNSASIIVIFGLSVIHFRTPTSITHIKLTFEVPFPSHVQIAKYAQLTIFNKLLAACVAKPKRCWHRILILLKIQFGKLEIN